VSGEPVERKGSRLRPFLLGGLVGGAIALAADRLTSRRGRPARTGPLAAFERAPCYREALEREREAGSPTEGSGTQPGRR
jgi:hypothetical protein